MNVPEKVRRVVFPSADLDKKDTGLRFTDILFGFVISQIFLRLQAWSDLTDFTRSQLICSTVLVLGSWIGFRRSLHRSEYELKFFNLPLFRFLLDQVMLILYFRVATLTPLESEGNPPSSHSIAHSTVKALLFVFILYFVWDLLGQWMAVAKGPNTQKRYSEHNSDLIGTIITFVFLVAFGAVSCWFNATDDVNSTAVMIASSLVLVAYRWAKDIRSALR